MGMTTDETRACPQCGDTQERRASKWFCATCKARHGAAWQAKHREACKAPPVFVREEVAPVPPPKRVREPVVDAAHAKRLASIGVWSWTEGS